MSIYKNRFQTVSSKTASPNFNFGNIRRKRPYYQDPDEIERGRHRQAVEALEADKALSEELREYPWSD